MEDTKNDSKQLQEGEMDKTSNKNYFSISSFYSDKSEEELKKILLGQYEEACSNLGIKCEGSTEIVMNRLYKGGKETSWIFCYTPNSKLFYLLSGLDQDGNKRDSGSLTEVDKGKNWADFEEEEEKSVPPLYSLDPRISFFVTRPTEISGNCFRDILYAVNVPKWIQAEDVENKLLKVCPKSFRGAYINGGRWRDDYQFPIVMKVGSTIFICMDPYTVNTPIAKSMLVKMKITSEFNSETCELTIYNCPKGFKNVPSIDFIWKPEENNSRKHGHEQKKKEDFKTKAKVQTQNMFQNLNEEN